MIIFEQSMCAYSIAVRVRRGRWASTRNYYRNLHSIISILKAKARSFEALCGSMNTSCPCTGILLQGGEAYRVQLLSTHRISPLARRQQVARCLVVAFQCGGVL